MNAAREPPLRAPAGIRAHCAPPAWVTAGRAELDPRMVFGTSCTLAGEDTGQDTGQDV
ncbi:hypothetical protein [Streptomyces sp. 8ZJF_21]|uniref:hypothetical protein n=1 Tax=Streptomyces sp. 8ZJF_21 TaxID=2903141 RepID=UPI001E479734|nr:hypothetical protein [Streptomyces sp. 8ZJF_21]MCD9589225.1 hypothetical protein [Streptomyces sp. 8ZJF_21]